MEEEPKEEQAQAEEESLDMSAELIRQGVIGGEDVNTDLAKQFGMEIFPEILEFHLTREVYDKVPYAFVKRHTVIPFDRDGERIVVAVSDPLNLDPIQDLRYMLDCDVKAVYTPRDAVLTAINECYNKETGAASKMIQEMADDTKEGAGEDEAEVYDLLDDSPGLPPVVKLLNLILYEAIQQGTSDIHFEPYEGGMRVRYRIDGSLQPRHSPAAEYQGPLMTRVKVMAKLDIAERRLPQDGRIKLKLGRREVDFRVSTVPVAGGERIVLRILDKGNVTLGLSRLGMLSHSFEEFRRLISMPEGIVLVTGPTGSGKTTTLYSAVTDLYSDDINIMTIEDPVEYNLKGIAQIGVKHKINLTFAAGLRTILRQDPDVVMVGEIRDKETAEIAIQASLTGHLVLSTLHTNDAPSSITRMVDMGVEPYLLSSSVVGVLAQRLVRTICPHCRSTIKPLAEDLATLGIKPEDLPNGEVHIGKGCDACFGTGYKGRHGVYELMSVNNEIRKQIVKSPDAVVLREIAIREGMTSLRTHGNELVKQGVTTIAEILRVTRTVEGEG